MTDKYVDTYLRLEDRASGAESKADEYRQRAEDNRWEQCRIVHEAVSSGSHTRVSFAKAVGTSNKTIGRQFAVWEQYGITASGNRPSYSDAVAIAYEGTTNDAETDRKQLVNARAVARNPEAVRELLRDPVVAAVVGEAVDERRRAQPKPRADEGPKGNAAFIRTSADMLNVTRLLERLVENINEARKSAYMKPIQIREFVAEARLYLDAIEEIANSRGLTDEALADWIGAE